MSVSSEVLVENRGSTCRCESWGKILVTPPPQDPGGAQEVEMLRPIIVRPSELPTTSDLLFSQATFDVHQGTEGLLKAP